MELRKKEEIQRKLRAKKLKMMIQNRVKNEKMN